MPYAITKRAMDLIGGIVGLSFTAAITPLVAGAILINSRGPVFFRQIRLTKNGRPFAFYKFRTMLIDRNLSIEERDAINEMGGPHFKSRFDPRITSVGRILRSFSIDELPQFWNVLKGEMSLVGPRPPLRPEYERYSRLAKKRLSVKTGMTGLWQISGRSSCSFDEMVELDIQYIEKASILFDLWIIFATIPTVLRRKGAW